MNSIKNRNVKPSPRNGTSTRSRGSKSPPTHRYVKHVPSEDTTPLLDSSYSISDDDDASARKDKKPSTEFQLSWSIVVGSFLLIGLAVLSFAVYWLALYTGLYDPEPDCPVPTFDYPECGNALMHVGTVAPPLSFDDWLDLRERYHHAIALGGKGAPSSMADDWREPNTRGFTDMSSLEFRYSPGKGRAVFAAKPIAKGSKIWDSRYRAVFPNSCVAKIYFQNQTNQQKCDAVFWGYDNNFYGNGVQYMADLDGHGYINHDGHNPNAVHHFEGELDQDRYPVSRLRIPSLGIFPLSQEQWKRRNRPDAYGLYATRDIPVGEEIFYNYDEIFVYGWIDWFTIFLSRSLPIREWATL